MEASFSTYFPKTAVLCFAFPLYTLRFCGKLMTLLFFQAERYRTDREDVKDAVLLGTSVINGQAWF